MSERSRIPPAWRAAAAVALVVAAVHAPLVGNGFVWDDWSLVAGNGALRGEGLLDALRGDLYAANPAAGPSGYWRPLAVLSFWVNAWFGAGPAPLHAGNVLLHALTAGLLTVFLARVLAGATLAAAAAALLWALHPQQVEAVAWISCRYELLTGLVAAGCLLLRGGEGLRAAIGTGAAFLAGLLSKESFVALAPVLVLDDLLARRPVRASWRRWVAIGAAVALWAAARAALGIRDVEADARTVLELPGRLLAAVGVYAGRAAWPAPLTIHHPFEPGPAGALAGAVVALALAALAWRHRRTAPASLWFVVSLAPSAIAMARMGIAAERYFYVPSIGLAWLAALGLARALGDPRRAVVRGAGAVVAAALLASAAAAVARSRDWRDDEALFRAALQVDGEDAYAHLFLGRRALEGGDLDAARRHLELAARREPRSAEAAAGLAEVHLRSGELAAARAAAARAVELDPAFVLAHLHLSWACHELGDHRCELDAAARARALSPAFVPAVLTEALARCEVERLPACERGIDALARAQAIDRATELVARASAALRRADGATATARIATLRRELPGHPELPRLEAQLRQVGGAPP